MAWLRLDDGYADNPEIDALSDGAFRLHASAQLHCARHLTDGHVAGYRVARLVPRFDQANVDELVAVGHWEPTEEGYYLPCYLETNPLASEVLKKREARAAAGRKGGQRSGASRRGEGQRPLFAPPIEANASANGEATPSPEIEPRPVPSRPTSSSSSTRAHGSQRGQVAVLEEEDQDLVEGPLAGASLILARRALDNRGPDLPRIANPAAWISTTADQRMAQHAIEAEALLEQHPGVSPDELADLLEPDPRRRRAMPRAPDTEVEFIPPENRPPIPPRPQPQEHLP